MVSSVARRSLHRGAARVTCGSRSKQSPRPTCVRARHAVTGSNGLTMVKASPQALNDQTRCITAAAFASGEVRKRQDNATTAWARLSQIQTPLQQRSGKGIAPQALWIVVLQRLRCGDRPQRLTATVRAQEIIGHFFEAHTHQAA